MDVIIKDTEIVPNRAGLICFNKAGHVLVISALVSPTTWVFPKGHIEKGETTQQAAVREALEEAGILATADISLGTTSFVQYFEDVLVEWWVGTAISKPISTDAYNEYDFRNVRWLPWQEAHALLSFPDLKKLLLRALCLPENYQPTTIVQVGAQ